MKCIFSNLIDQSIFNHKAFHDGSLFKRVCPDLSCNIINMHITTRHIKISKCILSYFGDCSPTQFSLESHIHIRHIRIGIIHGCFVKCILSDTHSIIDLDIDHGKFLINKYIITDSDDLLRVIPLCHIDSRRNTEHIRLLIIFFLILCHTHFVIIQQL